MAGWDDDDLDSLLDNQLVNMDIGWDSPAVDDVVLTDGDVDQGHQSESKSTHMDPSNMAHTDGLS